jgi:hypothetical protein
MEAGCWKCGKTGEETVLHKCKVCLKHFCEDHCVRRSGVEFCSMGCGVYFFHAEPDDDDE